MSRSFGDIHYKRLGMSAAPDIQVFNITPQDRFLLCACDGFWSCFGPQDAVKVVSDLCQTGRPLKAVCDRLVYMVRRNAASPLCTYLGNVTSMTLGSYQLTVRDACMHMMCFA